MKRFSNKYLLLHLAIFSFKDLQAQKSKSSDVYVDANGIMRWGSTNEEVHGFGINYTVPFAYGFRAAKELNVDIEKAIDNDVYHFARLGFDAFRVHVWDTEISDTLGNLLDNEHLRLFDYLIKKMKERKMKFLITPIAYWGNGWPAPDEKTPGFSAKYGKEKCLTDTDAIRAQQNYLYQFLNHKNQYTGIAYKDDPDVVAFEISNEPHHGEAAEKVTAFIEGMIKSMKNTGCKKPIFYNISHSIHLADAYFKAGINGGTFQWYPTGLGFRQELQGNLLPNVDRYAIPFADNSGFKKIAKVVYEFDAADVGRSYIYPAMARSFRTAGMQWATHFAYDPTYTAYANTEYNTHYMNLAYTPQKALGLMIAGEVFHKVPLYKSYGAYPADTLFDDFKVSDQNDLAEMLTADKFIYTNNTKTSPADVSKLNEIAGTGSSPLVSYEGSGAYFLNKLKDGIWRLEVMPDAIWINDPFGINSLKKTVAVINWRKWNMELHLPDLGDYFSIKGLNDGNKFSTDTDSSSFMISPGVYLLTKKGLTAKYNGNERIKNIQLKEFTATSTTLDKTYVLHQPPAETDSAKAFTVEATIASIEEPAAVELHVWSGWRPIVLLMEKKLGYNYTATIPGSAMRQGFLRYNIAVKEKGIFRTYPSGFATYPKDWDFYDQDAYKVRVVPSSSPIYLFDAFTDADEVAKEWNRNGKLLPTSEPGKAEMIVNVDKMFSEDVENKNAEKIYDYSMRYSFAKKIAGRVGDLLTTKKIVLHGRALNNKPCILQLALITRDGNTYGGLVKVEVNAGDYSIDLSDLKSVKLVTLPRPYPSFLPYYFENSSGNSFDLNKIETIQVSIGPGIPERELQDKHGVAIESIRLE